MTAPVAILAGGLATRLRPITLTVPKALVSVAGKPFIVHQLDLLRRNGLSRVVLCVGYLGEMLQAEIGDGSQFEMSVEYSFDGPKLLGTAGALKRALPLLGESFYVLYGDSYLDCDYRTIYDSFHASGKTALMTVYANNNQWDRSNVIFEQGRIIRYDKRERVPEMRYIDYGLGILHRSVIDQIAPDTVADLADIYTALAQNGDLAGYEVANRFYEIGTPEGLAELERKLS